MSNYYGANFNQTNSAISGSKVVWQDWREGSCVIYWKDIISGNGGRVSDYFGSNLNQTNPAISDSKVVWQDMKIVYKLISGQEIVDWSLYMNDVITSGNDTLIAG